MARVMVLGSLAESLINFRGPLLAAMVEAGHEVHGVSPSPGVKVTEALNAMGVRCHSIPLNRTGLGLGRDFLTLLALIRLFRKLRPDYLLAYTIKPIIYGGIAARLTNVPYFFAMITGLGYAFSGLTPKSRLVGRLARPLYQLALAQAVGVFFQNPDNLEVFREAGLLRRPAQAVLINGSGVDLSYFKPSPFPDQIAFLMIARLLRDKGVFEYIESARALKRRYPDAHFYLVGWIDDNPDAISQSDLDAWIQEGVVEYLGHLKDVRPAIENASVYCLPSYHEGMPRTVLEAMAMGRPVVTTDVAGCRSTVIDEVNGFLVPAGDSDALAGALEKFIVEPGLVSKMGKASRQIAVDKFDVREVNRVILSSMGLGSEKAV